jgi:site-specific recombinase XerD
MPRSTIVQALELDRMVEGRHVLPLRALPFVGHTAASNLAQGGATPIDIAAVLGHKTLAMVKHYAHLSESRVRQVVSQMNERGAR